MSKFRAFVMAMFGVAFIVAIVAATEGRWLLVVANVLSALAFAINFRTTEA